MQSIKTAALATLLALGLAACNENDSDVGADVVEEDATVVEPVAE